MRRAFTLVELLVVISIVALLSTLMLGALYTAQDAAKAQKTRSTIAKIHTALMSRYESYQTRRVPIAMPDKVTPKVAAAMRLTALRQVMLSEMPDRNSEVPALTVTSASFPFSWVDSSGVTRNHTVVVPRSSLSMSYGRRLGTPADTTFQAAELLYLILTTSLDDDSDSSTFGQSEIGDKDGDGRNEIWDAWRNPISFIRWPSGFQSEFQSLNATNDHDSFDSRTVHAQAFKLVPLVFSPGPDGEYELDSQPTHVFTTNSDGILNPYDVTLGDWTDQNGDGANDSVDNIHNHLMMTR